MTIKVTNILEIGDERIVIKGTPIVTAMQEHCKNNDFFYKIKAININPIMEEGFIEETRYTILSNCIWPVAFEKSSGRVIKAMAYVFGQRIDLQVDELINSQALIQIISSGEISKVNYDKKIEDYRFRKEELERAVKEKEMNSSIENNLKKTIERFNEGDVKFKELSRKQKREAKGTGLAIRDVIMNDLGMSRDLVRTEMIEIIDQQVKHHLNELSKTIDARLNNIIQNVLIHNGLDEFRTKFRFHCNKKFSEFIDRFKVSFAPGDLTFDLHSDIEEEKAVAKTNDELKIGVS